MTEDEARPVGVTWRVYWNYFQAAGGFWALLVIFLTNVLLRVSFLCFDYFTALSLSSMGMASHCEQDTLMQRLVDWFWLNQPCLLVSIVSIVSEALVQRLDELVSGY